MSVYLKDDKIVLQDDLVATSTDCCCLNGACCFPDGHCEVETETKCVDDGGTYQGDDTDCDTTGACCIGTDCSITTEACCTGSGGTYQGDDTTCDPNPCEVPACGECVFVDTFGNNWLTKTVTSSGTVHCDPSEFQEGYDGDYSGTAILDCSSGELVVSCVGSGTDCRPGFPTPTLEPLSGDCWWMEGMVPVSASPFYPISCGTFDNPSCTINTWYGENISCSSTCFAGCVAGCDGSMTVTVEYSNPCTPV